MEEDFTQVAIWSLFDHLTEGVIIAESDGLILYRNSAAQTLLDSHSQHAAPTTLHQLLGATAAHTLLHPPANVNHLAHDRSLHLHAHRFQHHGQQLVQILIDPPQAPAVPEETHALIDQLSTLTRISSEPDFDRKLQFIVNSLQRLGWNRVGLSLRDEVFNVTKFISAGFTKAEKKHILNNILPPSTWMALFNEDSLQQYRYGSCYFVPGESDWAKKYLGTILPDPTATASDPDAWHPKDLLCAVLLDRQQQRIGLIGLDQPRNGRRPGPRMLQTLELYAQFASSILENTQLVQELLSRSREFETLLEASHAFSGTLDKTTILTYLGRHLHEAAKADDYTIYRWHEQNEQLIVLQTYANAYTNKLPTPGTVIDITHADTIRDVLQQQVPKVISSGELPILPRPDWLPRHAPCLYTLVPIIRSGETYGLVHLTKQNHDYRLSERDTQLLGALARQAGTALDTALIFEDTYEREQFYNALGNVNMALNFTLDSQRILDLICSEGVRIFDVDGAYIWQLNGGHFIGVAAEGHAATQFLQSRIALSDSDTFVTQLAQNAQAMFLNNVPDTDVAIIIPQADAVQSILGVPLEQEGRIIGFLILVDTHNPQRFSGKELSWATLFGVQVAITLQNANLFAELRRFNEELDERVAERTQALIEESRRVKILLRITTDLSASLDQDRVLNLALSLVNEVVNATHGIILLVNPTQDELILRASLGFDHPLLPQGMPSGLRRDEGLAGWMIENRSAVTVQDTHTDPRWQDFDMAANQRSVLGVPLIASEEVIGVMLMFHPQPHAFTTQQLDLVEAAAIQVANAINNAGLYRLIFDQAEQLGTRLRTERIQKANLQAILESIADGVLVANNDNHIELVNVPASRILDIPREQLLGKPITELHGLYGHFESEWMETINNWARNADHIPPGTFLADQLLIEERVLSVHLSPVILDKFFYGTVSIFRDITREVALDKLKSEFVSTVSHELRTPMTSIKGYVELMLMGAAGETSDSQNRYLQVIKNNADRLHMLVNDLLDISRIETGKTELDLRPLAVPTLVEQVVKHLDGRIQHEGKPLTVNIKLNANLPLVNADRAKVTQILTNLLDNAFNYTPEDGEIAVSAHANGNHVFISVADTGIGISQENIDKIFDRFYRAEDAHVQRVPGTGLGLAIVQSLVEMHGGELTVQTTLNQGSTFTFNLPIVVEDDDLTSITF